MSQWNRQIFRFVLVLALGAGLAGQAARPDKPGLRAEKTRPEPIILATVIESSVPEQCLLNPRDEDESAADARKSGVKVADLRDKDGRARRKVIACG
jgi:hypothetical protein